MCIWTIYPLQICHFGADRSEHFCSAVFGKNVRIKILSRLTGLLLTAWWRCLVTSDLNLVLFGTVSS